MAGLGYKERKLMARDPAFREKLLAKRKEGMSLLEVAFWVRQEYGVQVDTWTVAKWLRKAEECDAR